MMNLITRWLIIGLNRDYARDHGWRFHVLIAPRKPAHEGMMLTARLILEIGTPQIGWIWQAPPRPSGLINEHISSRWTGLNYPRIVGPFDFWWPFRLEIVPWKKQPQGQWLSDDDLRRMREAWG